MTLTCAQFYWFINTSINCMPFWYQRKIECWKRFCIHVDHILYIIQFSGRMPLYWYVKIDRMTLNCALFRGLEWNRYFFKFLNVQFKYYIVWLQKIEIFAFEMTSNTFFLETQRFILLSCSLSFELKNADSKMVSNPRMSDIYCDLW